MNELQRRIISQEPPQIPEGLTAERRREPRTRSARLVYLQPADLSTAPFEEVRTMANHSRDGFYFVTPRNSYCAGMRLRAIPAFGCFNFEYIAEVVRVEDLPLGEHGVAVHLLRIENLLDSTTTATKSAFESFALADPLVPVTGASGSEV